MMAGRNQIYCEPFDVFDPNAPLRGKKRFNENFRPLRSKINLQIKDAGVQARDRNNRVTVPQQTIDDFNKAYAENCDQEAMRWKHRNVGPSNPFHPKNVPPEQYRVPEKVTASPNVMDHTGFDSNAIKFSGRMSPLGAKLLADHRKAS